MARPPLPTLGLNTLLTSQVGGTDPPAEASSSGSVQAARAGAIQGAAHLLARTRSSDKEQDSRRRGTLSCEGEISPPAPTVQQLPRLLQRRTHTLCGCPGTGEKSFFF